MDIDPSVLLMTLINFFILVLILKHFFWEKIRIAIQDREDFIQELFYLITIAKPCQQVFIFFLVVFVICISDVFYNIIHK